MNNSARRRHQQAHNTSDNNPMDTLGHVSAPAPMQDTQALAKKRQKRGECVTCGQKTHKVSMFGRQRSGLNIDGKVITGICLKCHPIEGYIQRPDRAEEQAGPVAYQRQEERAVVPNVVDPRTTRGTRPEDDHGTLISGLTLDPFFRNAYDNDESTRGASIARSAGGSPIAMPRRLGPDQQQLKLLHQQQMQLQRQHQQGHNVSSYDAFRIHSGVMSNPRLQKRGILKGMSYVDEQQETEDSSRCSLTDSVYPPSVNRGGGAGGMDDQDSERDLDGFSELGAETVETVSVAKDPYSYGGGGVMLQYGTHPRDHTQSWERLVPLTENIRSVTEPLPRTDATNDGVGDRRGKDCLLRRLETLSGTSCDENKIFQRPSTPPIGTASSNLNSVYSRNHSADAAPPSPGSELPTPRSRSRSGLNLTRPNRSTLPSDDPHSDGSLGVNLGPNRLKVKALAQKWRKTKQDRVELHRGKDEGHNVNTSASPLGSGSFTRSRGSGGEKSALNLLHTEQRVQSGDDNHSFETNDQPTTNSSTTSVPSQPPSSRHGMASNMYPSDELTISEYSPSTTSASTENRTLSIETDRMWETKLRRGNSFIVEQEGYYPPSVSSRTPEGKDGEEKVEIDLVYLAKHLSPDNRQWPTTIRENDQRLPNRMSHSKILPRERTNRDVASLSIGAHNPISSRISENDSNDSTPKFFINRHDSRSARGTGESYVSLSSQSGSSDHRQLQTMNEFGNTSMSSTRSSNRGAENDVHIINSHENKQLRGSDRHEGHSRDNSYQGTYPTIIFNQDPPGQESQMPTLISVSARNSPRFEFPAPPLYSATVEYSRLVKEESTHESVDQFVPNDLSDGDDENDKGSERSNGISRSNTSSGNRNENKIDDDEATQIQQFLKNYSKAYYGVSPSDARSKNELLQSRDGYTNGTHGPPKVLDIPIIIKCLKSSHINELLFKDLFDLATRESTDGKLAIIKCGGVLAIIEGMWAHMGDDKVQSAGLYTLWALCAAENLECDPMVQADTTGIIDVVLISMQSHLQCVPVQEAGCGALSCLASASCRGVCIDQVASAGGMLTVVSAMENHLQDLDVQEWGLRALYCECMASEANKKSFAVNGNYGEGNVDIIYKSMRAFPSELGLQEWGCRLYYCLSGCEEIINVLSITVEPLEALICALNQFNQRNDSAALLANACGALSNFATLSKQNVTPILTAGGIPAVIGAMVAFPQSEQVQIEGCAAIANITTLKQCRVQVAEKGGTGTIITAMKSFPFSEVLQEEACRALRSVWVECDFGSDAASSDVAIPVIISALKSHLRSESLQEMACNLLAALAVDSGHRLSIFDAGGLSVLLDAMAMHGRVRLLQEAACSALQNLTLCEDRFLEQVSCIVATVIRAMAAHEKSEETQLCACHIFWNLSITSRTEQLVKAGVVKYIIKAMQHHPESSLVQRVACGALWSLMTKSDDVKVALVDEGGIDAIICALVMYPFDSEVLENACGALSVLCVIRDNARSVASNGGIGTVVECMRNHVSSAVMITHGSLFLRNMALVSSNYAEEASACASILLRGMQEHLQNVDLQVECLGALWALAANSDTCKERFLYADGIEVVREVMNAHKTVLEVESEGEGALSQLMPGR